MTTTSSRSSTTEWQSAALCSHSRPDDQATIIAEVDRAPSERRRWREPASTLPPTVFLLTDRLTSCLFREQRSSAVYMSEQFLNGTSAHNRPFQCHPYTWRESKVQSKCIIACHQCMLCTGVKMSNGGRYTSQMLARTLPQLMHSTVDTPGTMQNSPAQTSEHKHTPTPTPV